MTMLSVKVWHLGVQVWHQEDTRRVFLVSHLDTKVSHLDTKKTHDWSVEQRVDLYRAGDLSGGLCKTCQQQVSSHNEVMIDTFS